MVGAFIFDMDGLLLDTELVYLAAWQDAVGQLGFVLSEELYHSFLGRSDRESEEALRVALGPDFPIDSFRKLWPDLFARRVARDGIVVKPGMARLTRLLKEKQVPLALATSSTWIRAELGLRITGLADYFSVVVTCESVVHAKPSPEIFLAAAARLDVEASSCIVLEDSDAGAEAAVAAGMRVIVIPDLRPPSPRTREIAWAVHESGEDTLPLVMALLDL